jgi:hypothetical protein
MCLDASAIKTSFYTLDESVDDEFCRPVLDEVLAMPHEFSMVTTERGVFNVVIGDSWLGWTEVVADATKEDLRSIAEALYDYSGPLM